MKNNFASHICNLCLYSTLLLINIAYCPGIILTPNYNIIILITFACLGLILFITLKEIPSRIIKWLFIYFSTTLAYSCLTFIFSGIFPFGIAQNIILSTIFIIIGYSVRGYNSVSFTKITKVFIFSSLFLGMYSVIKNVNGFIITDTYAFSLKNSSSVLLATSIILCTYIITETTIKRKLLWYILLALLSLCLITFRCRTAILGTAIGLFFIICRKKLLLNIFNIYNIGLIITALLTIYIFNLSPIDFLYDSLFANKDVNDVNSITSGRLSTYQIGMDVFGENPWFGNSAVNKDLPPIDNFLISTLSTNGICGALINFPIYIITWIVCIWGICKQQGKELYPFILLLLLCLTSITEAPFPYGPGTSVFFSWFFFGWHIKEKEIQKHPINKI